MSGQILLFGRIGAADGGSLFVTFLELVDPSGRIYQDILTGKERVRGIGDFQFDQGVFVPIFPLGCFPGLSRGAAKKGVSITHILENNEPIVCRVETFFHNCSVYGCTDLAVQFLFRPDGPLIKSAKLGFMPFLSKYFRD
jgi:hypothetical protein